MTLTEIFNGFARVITTDWVCGCTRESMRNTASSSAEELRRASVIASAAAVPSSSIDALQIGKPVKSLTIVWNAKSASRRPWLISG